MTKFTPGSRNAREVLRSGLGQDRGLTEAATEEMQPVGLYATNSVSQREVLHSTKGRIASIPGSRAYREAMTTLFLNRQSGGGGAWSPSELLTGASQLAYYDPSDLTTLFQDSAGTTPVTADGQSVGLVLDKSGQLGAEILTDGDYSDISGWTLAGGTATVTAGILRLENVSTRTTFSRAFTTVIGTKYRLSVSTISDGNSVATSARVRVVTADSFASTIIASAVSTTANGFVTFVATGTTTYIYLGNNTTTAGLFIEFGPVSIKPDSGNHLIQSTLGSRPLYGFAPATGVRNLLTKTEQFDNAAWTKSNSSVAAVGTEWKFIPNNGSTFATVFVTQTLTASAYACALDATAAGFNFLQIYITGYGHVNFDLATGTVGTTSGGWAGAIENLGGGKYRCKVVTGTLAASSLVLRVAIPVTASSGLGALATGDGTSGILLNRAQLELGSTATAYQKVNTVNGVTEAGVPTVHFLRFDGTDDFLVSAANLDPGAVDKAQLFAGARKLSDAAGLGVATELGTYASNGTISVGAPAGISPTYRFGSVGSISASATSPSSYAAPITNVLTGIGDISGDFSGLRIDGSLVASVVTDQGVGNYVAAPLYIGRRSGTTLPFNGNIYSLIVRFSAANLDAAVIDSAEAWTAGKTGIVL